MRIRALLLVRMTALGLALNALPRPPEKPRSGVVLNPNPAQAPKWGLKWERWELPEPPRLESTDGGARLLPHTDDAVQEVAWNPDADPRIWATPAEFSAED